MARPKKDKMDYFPHDTDAVNDEKIEALRSIYGNDGYAFYFILLERIYRTEKAELDVSKPILVSSLSSKVGVSKERFDKMLKDACDLQLFDFNELENNQVITSIGVKKRFSEVNKIRQRWRKSKENSEEKEVFRAENSKENESKTDIFHEENTLETGESKVKESKVKEIKEKDYKEASATRENPFTFWEENGFGTISPLLTENVNYWLDGNFFDEPENIVIHAMKEALLNNARSWKYVESALTNWQNNKLRKLRDVEAYIAAYKAKKVGGGRAKRDSESSSRDFDKSEYFSL